MQHFPRRHWQNIPLLHSIVIQDEDRHHFKILQIFLFFDIFTSISLSVSLHTWLLIVLNEGLHYWKKNLSVDTVLKHSIQLTSASGLWPAISGIALTLTVWFYEILENYYGEYEDYFLWSDTCSLVDSYQLFSPGDWCSRFLQNIINVSVSFLSDFTGEAGDLHNRKVSPCYMCSAHPARWSMLSCMCIMCSLSLILMRRIFLKLGCTARKEYHY